MNCEGMKHLHSLKKSISDYNEFLSNYLSGADHPYNAHVLEINQLFQNFIDLVELRIMEQNNRIDDTVTHIKNNLSTAITNLLNSMRENGELDEVVLNAFDDVLEAIAHEEEYRQLNDKNLNNAIIENTKRIERLTGSVGDSGRIKHRAMISFTDDDCKTATHSLLFPIIKKWNIPYTIACPVDSIGDDGFMGYDDLKEMYDYGVKISGHTRKESGMNNLTEQQLEEILAYCDAEFKEWGVNDVIAYAYCNGQYNLDYINTIKKYFKCGFTVDKGINAPPLETYFLKRVEIFPQNQSYTFDDVKRYVDDVATNGGWLIFMTHAWYPTFNGDNLDLLIDYIVNDKKIPIVDIQEGLNSMGNIIETGCFHKPLYEAVAPFTVVDVNGILYTNAFDNYTPSENEEVVHLTLKQGRIINSSTGKDVSTSDPAYVVNEQVDISDCSSVIIGGWAYEGFNKFSFLKEDGSYLTGEKATTSYDGGGDYFERYKVEIPTGAKYLIVGGYIYNKSPAITKVYGDISNKNVGDLSELETKNKESIVDSINEIVGYLRTLGIENKTDITNKYQQHENLVIKASGNRADYTSASGRFVTEGIAVNEGETYYLDCCANWNNACFAIYSDLTTRNETTDLQVYASNNDETGTVLKNHKVTIPTGGKSMVVCCNTAMSGYVPIKIVKAETL